MIDLSKRKGHRDDPGEAQNFQMLVAARIDLPLSRGKKLADRRRGVLRNSGQDTNSTVVLIVQKTWGVDLNICSSTPKELVIIALPLAKQP